MGGKEAEGIPGLYVRRPDRVVAPLAAGESLSEHQPLSPAQRHRAVTLPSFHTGNRRAPANREHARGNVLLDPHPRQWKRLVVRDLDDVIGLFAWKDPGRVEEASV